jgi:hypothetical protein
MLAESQPAPAEADMNSRQEEERRLRVLAVRSGSQPLRGGWGGRAAGAGNRGPFLGSIPIDPDAVYRGDNGKPFAANPMSGLTGGVFGDRSPDPGQDGGSHRWMPNRRLQRRKKCFRVRP